jgi:DNA invertase Pin-like site-specific DNA recombinase
MEHIAYIRVSSIDQNIARQVAALPEVDEKFIEKASGSSANRPVLKEMLKYVRKGDHIHVHSIDRLARNIVDLNNLVTQIVKSRCVITFHKENMAFGNGKNEATSQLLFNILGSFAQFERSLIKERQAEGIAAAKAQGKHMGRPSKLSHEQKEAVKSLHSCGATPTELARQFSVSRATIYDIVKI